jgi:FkbM family methyltransferase
MRWPNAWMFLRNRPIRTVIDVGANSGQFASMINGICPAARLLSFEPLPDCLPALEAVLREIPGSRAYPLALGSLPGRARFNRSCFSPSSSLLEMAPRHKVLWPQSAEHTFVDVQVERLDNALAGIDLLPEILLKIDVQGYEQHVLEGAPRTLAATDVVVVEVCYDPLYNGQATFDDLYSTLRGFGFTFKGTLEQFVDPESGRIVFADVLFERGG